MILNDKKFAMIRLSTNSPGTAFTPMQPRFSREIIHLLRNELSFADFYDAKISDGDWFTM